MKDGTEFPAMFISVGSMIDGCQSGALLEDLAGAYSILQIGKGDDSTEKLNMLELKSIEFLPRPRKDKLGNAMLDTWHYSPFTGERLAQ